MGVGVVHCGIGLCLDEQYDGWMVMGRCVSVIDIIYVQRVML